MKVQDLMTRSVQTCRPEDSMETAARLLWETDCGCLPVVDGDGRVQGIITDRDICMGAYTQGRKLSDLSVSTAMSASAVTCRPEDDLAEAVRRMCENEVRRIPVVDRDKKVRGVLSLNDLVCAADADCAESMEDVVGSKAWMVLASVSRHRTNSQGGNARSSAEIKPALPQTQVPGGLTKPSRPQPRA